MYSQLFFVIVLRSVTCAEMSDAEYEAFEVNDYDLDTEFNPNRSRRRPTKQQQIYGELDGFINVEFTILKFPCFCCKKNVWK